MSEPAQDILRAALRLRPNERAALVEQLSASLDKPDPLIDALWLKEVESRLAAYRAGELDAVDTETVFAGSGGHAA